jgi:hypothetical protein
MVFPGHFILAACTEPPSFFSKLFEPATMAAVIVAMTAVIVMIVSALNFITYRAVAKRQLKIDEARLASERYGRKYKVYEAVIGYLLISGCKEMSEVTITKSFLDFIERTASATFLFPNEICDFIDEVRKKRISSESPEDVCVWFMDQYYRAPDIFKSDMDLSK